MSDAHGVARDQLRAFIERIERLEEEKKTIADDIKDVYGEAKGTGFDTKILRKVISLGLGEPAGHRHVGANAANPQAQEQLTAHLEKLEFMLQALGEVISQQGAVLKEMNRAHSASASSENAIVVAAEQGGAA